MQLALLDLSRKDLTAAAKTIGQIRARWKEAAAADLLDAQLALASEDPRAAAVHLEAALAKDPNNKVALFWKALLDERNGAKGKASQALQTIVKDKPVKEIEDGLSLTRAAEWALADMALQNQDLDSAIKRFEGLVQANPGSDLDRAARWKLVAARAGRGDGAKAKAEVAELLASPKTTAEERVQAADFYRRQGDDAACRAQLDLVLKADPTNTGAVAYKALALASKGQPEQAAALIRKTLATAEGPALEPLPDAGRRREPRRAQGPGPGPRPEGPGRRARQGPEERRAGPGQVSGPEAHEGPQRRRRSSRPPPRPTRRGRCGACWPRSIARRRTTPAPRPSSWTS